MNVPSPRLFKITMVRFYNYSAEKKDASFADLYLMAIFVAFVLVFVIVASGYGIKFLVEVVIKYWLWVLGILGLIAIARHYWNKGQNKKRRDEICGYH